MPTPTDRTICWAPTWNEPHEGVGLEHLLLGAHRADSVVLWLDAEQGPVRLGYRLTWDRDWRLSAAELTAVTRHGTRSLVLHTDGQGHWRHGDGHTFRLVSEANSSSSGSSALRADTMPTTLPSFTTGRWRKPLRCMSTRA